MTSSRQKSIWTVIALSAIAMSTLILEIVITKFLAIKVEHHYAYAILGMVVLSFGAAGAFIYMKGGALGTDTEAGWILSAKNAALYALTIPLAVAIFCWIPINPYPSSYSDLPYVCLLGLPSYFIILSIPFFFGGICVSHALSASRLPVTLLYFWDLLAAAAGALICPFLLDKVGGYGVAAVSSSLGLIGFFAFQKVSGKSIDIKCMGLCASVVCAIFALLAYPSCALSTYGYDIRSSKEPSQVAVAKVLFGGIRFTHWNAIARLDLSRTAESDDNLFLAGLSPKAHLTLPGRFILNDGGAFTRQFKVTGDISEQHHLHDAIWASPYIALNRISNHSLVIGGGGGIDILIGKYFKAPKIDVVELNPSTVRVLSGKLDDPENDYHPWLASDKQTEVKLFNEEARHYASGCAPQKYDTIQASGVDTLTAVVTGGLALTENYLYTLDAVSSYARLLKPGGILSLTHWRLNPPAQPLRMMLTYIHYLEQNGAKDASKNVMVIGGPDWTDSMMKTEPFTFEQVQSVRKWCEQSGQTLIFDPLAEQPPSNIRPSERVYFEVAHANQSKRKEIVDGYLNQISPVTDDKPYFYNCENTSTWLFWTLGMLLLTAVVFASLIVFLPIVKARKDGLKAEVFPYILFFAICGFAFFLFETATIQLFTILVGGPLYALSVVLVCVLSGYSIGSYLAQYIKASRTTYFALSTGLFALFVVFYFSVHAINHFLIAFDLPLRILGCSLVTLLVSIGTGIPVSLSMNLLRERWGSLVTWMWGVSSAFNALGAAAFVPLAQGFGISFIILVVAVLYGVGTLVFAFNLKEKGDLPARSCV